ncbi:M20 metallopeptidase family protein [Mesobacillus harenae]|uniref:M20 metallopeptidase family protein n=1 Tax=Mesobacillus harenae TaxID=2213203 RepID=UPI00158066C9|nr:M20 family metallopeptidase [Mesobacillus harenae]
MSLINPIEIQVKSELKAKLLEIRKHLHKYPELSFEEFKTSEYIGKCLSEWGIPFNRICETGIVVDIIGEMGSGPHIGIRADIDALPIQEKTGLPFASCHPGIMHGCGHDGHTAILLGTVYQLYNQRKNLNGRVRCIFQPGEEADGAAAKLIEQGVLDNPNLDAMLALHLWPHLPHGTIGIRYGAITASCDDFIIEIEGMGGHSARPHQAIDAIAISAQVLQAIPAIVTKFNNPVEPVVIHIGKIAGGTANNVVAERVTLEGTTRAVTYETRERIKAQLINIVQNITQSFGGKAQVHYKESHSPVINSEWVTKAIEKSSVELFGRESVVQLKEPSMGADDFGAFAEKVPSTYFRLGTAQGEQTTYDLHHPQFNFDDSIIPIGVNLLTYTVLNRLQKECHNHVYKI